VSTAIYYELHNEELRDLCRSSILKSKRLRETGHVTRMGEIKCYCTLVWKILECSHLKE